MQGSAGQLSSRTPTQRQGSRTSKHVSSTPQLAAAKESDKDLPKAKEVWRWVKNLVQEHIILKEQLNA